MNIYIFSNGKEYTEEQVIEAAKRSNMSVEAYIAKAGLKLSTEQDEPVAQKKQTPKKQTPAVPQETTTAEEPKSTVSKSATTSSVSKKNLFDSKPTPSFGEEVTGQKFDFKTAGQSKQYKAQQKVLKEAEAKQTALTQAKMEAKTAKIKAEKAKVNNEYLAYTKPAEEYMVGLDADVKAQLDRDGKEETDYVFNSRNEFAQPVAKKIKIDSFAPQKQQVITDLAAKGQLKNYDDKQILALAAEKYKKEQITKHVSAKTAEFYDQFSVSKEDQKLMADYKAKDFNFKNLELQKKAELNNKLSTHLMDTGEQLSELTTKLEAYGKDYKFKDQTEVDEYNAMLSQYKVLSEDFKNVNTAFNINSSDFAASKEKLKSAEEEFDLAKRNYGWENYGKRAIIPFAQMGGSILQLTNLAMTLNPYAWAADYFAQSMGIKDASFEGRSNYIAKAARANEEILANDLRKTPEITDVKSFLEASYDVVITQVPNLILMALTGGGSAAARKGAEVGAKELAGLTAKELATKEITGIGAKAFQTVADNNQFLKFSESAISRLALTPELRTIAAISGGQKYNEMQAEKLFDGAKYSPIQMIAASALYGYAEGLGEKVTLDIFKGGVRTIKSAFEKGAEKGFIDKLKEKTVVDWFGDTGKFILNKGKDFSNENISEQFTNVVQNSTDKLLLNKNVNILDNTGDVFKDTSLLSVWMISAPHAFGLAVKPFVGRDSSTELKDNSAAIAKYQVMLQNPNITPAEKSAYETKINQLTDKSSNIFKKVIKNIEGMPSSTFQGILKSTNELGSILQKAKEVYNSDSVDKDSALKILEEEYKAKEKTLDKTIQETRTISELGDNYTIEDKQKLFKLNNKLTSLRAEITQLKNDPASAALLADKQMMLREVNSQLDEIVENAQDETLQAFNKDIEKLRIASEKLDMGGELDIAPIAEDTDSLAEYLRKNTNFTESDIQNRINNNYGIFITKEEMKDPNAKDTIVINKEIALADQRVTTGQHEFLHKILYKAVKNNVEFQIKIGEDLYGFMDKLVGAEALANTTFGETYNEYKNRFNKREATVKEKIKEYKEQLDNGKITKSYYDGAVKSANELIATFKGNFVEETLTMLSESLTSGDIKYNETLFTKLGDVIRNILQSLGIKIKFDNGRDVFNFVRDYNKSFEKGKFNKAFKSFAKEGEYAGKKAGTSAAKQVSKESLSIQDRMDALDDLLNNDEIDYDTYERRMDALIKEEEKALKAEKEKPKEVQKEKAKEAPKTKNELENEVKEILVNNKATVASSKVQQIYDKEGVNGAQKIIDLFKPITAKIVDKRRDAPGFDRELLTDEIETGAGGILDMIQKYDPKSGIPLAAYINKYLPVRAITASQRVLDKSFSKDIEDQKGLMATETAEQTVTTQATEKKKFTTILEAKMFENEVINSIIGKTLSVLRTLKTKINEPISKNVTATPLIREIRDEMGKQADIDIKTALGGKEGGVLKRNLLTNKKVILENMTTTWLMGKDTKNGVMGGVPSAIQKQVDGKWLSYPDWVGKTPDREKTTTDLAGRTSGADMVRRLPNVNNNISNEDFLSWFLEPSGNPIRGRKESLSKALAEEISFDIIANDFANEGPLFEAFSANQERLGAAMEKVVAVEFNRQMERGNVKESVRVQAVNRLNKANYNVNDPAYKDWLETLNPEEQRYLNDTLNIKTLENLINEFKAIYNTNKGYEFENNFLNIANAFLKANAEQYPNVTITTKKGAGSNSKQIDLQIKIGESSFNIELKYSKDAQIGSVTFKNIFASAVENLKNKKLTSVDLGDDLNNLMASALDSNSAALREYYDFLMANGGIVNRNGNIRVPIATYMQAQQLGLQSRATTTVKTDVSIINKLNTKKNDAIAFKDQGAFKLEGSKFGDNMPSLEGDVVFNIRATRGKRNKQDYTTIYFRGFPKMDKDWAQKSNVETSENAEPLINAISISDNVNNSTIGEGLIKESLRSAKNKAENPKKIRVFDFDDTLARTKSNVLYTMPEDFVVYHGAPIGKDISKPSRKGVTYFATDEREASEYARMNNGEVQKVVLNTDNMINEDQAIDKINELGLKPKDPNWTVEEQSFYELIDPRFEGALSENDINKLFKEFSKEGITSIAYIDGAQVSGKTTRSIAVIDNSIISEQKKMDAATFAKEGSQMLLDGAEFDFSEFKKVMEGKPGPLFDVAKTINEKTTGDIFVLTARPAEAALPIHEFLKELGLNIPVENITGLGNSAPQAKAGWIASKAAEGYNDFYFADDHLGNVKAVKEVLDELDVKGRVQQAQVKDSLRVGTEFNKIIAKNKNVSPAIKYSGITAKRLGSKKGKYKFFLPPGAEDFEGLLYSFIGKGRVGEEQAKFFEKTLIDPYWDGVAAIESARQKIKKDFIALKEAFPEAAKKITKRTPDGNFTYDQAVRVYLWTKEGVKIPDLSKTDQRQLNRMVQGDAQLLAFANGLELISGRDGKWSEPSEFWDSETIVSELNNMTEKIGRKKYLEKFIENADEMFTDENLNKIEALYGADFRDALEDSLYRMKNGKNRSQGAGKFTTAVSTWVNGSVAEIMFLNTKSGILQLISALNYLNLNDNNPIMAGKALLNFPQFAKDFAMIFNSDMMKERRQGLKEDVSAAEIANAAANAKNKVRALVAYLAKIGFTPTTIADALAIGMGGATFYRNRVNSYVKKGLDIKEAEAKAWKDFTRLTNKSAQSNDPALISQQQAEPIGRLILAFGNATMQMNRIMKKSAKDLINGRGNPAEHISRILFYGFIQNALFSALQKALFIGLFGTPDDEEDKKKAKTTEEKALGLADDMLDSFLRGSGIAGAVVSTVKNTAQQYVRQRDKGAKGDQAYTLLEGLNISPSIGSKARKVYSAIQEEKYNREVIKRMGGDVMLEGRFNPSPIYAVGAKVTAAATNLPADRVLDKITNINEALDARNENWQRAMLMLGYKPFELGVKNEEQEFLKRLGTADFTARELRELPIEKREQVREARRENKKEKIEKLKEKRAEKRAERREKRRRLYE